MSGITWTRGGKVCVGCIAWTLWGLKCPPPFVKRLVMHLECFVYLHCLQYCLYRSQLIQHVAVYLNRCHTQQIDSKEISQMH